MNYSTRSIRERLGDIPSRAALISAVFVLGCGDEPPPAALVARPVKLLEVNLGVSTTLEFPGTIAAAQHSSMAFDLPGKIIELPVTEGQIVRRGDLLARIDPRDVQAVLDVEAAQVRQARAEYERQKKLFEADVSPQQELDRAQRTYEVAQAKLEGASKLLEDTELHAPFDGTVAKKLVKDFANVRAKQDVLILQDTSTLEIHVAIPESDFANMTPGLTLEERTARVEPLVIVTALPDRSFPARIKEFNTTADPVTRTFQATAIFEPPGDVVIQPGMTAKVRIHPKGGPIARDGSFSIPANAALTDETGQAFVWIVDSSTMTVARTPVELGELSGSQVAVTSGLASGQQIAVSGVHQLRDGMKVRRHGG